MSAEITRIARLDKGRLSKCLYIGDDGVVHSDSSQCRMTDGHAKRDPAGTAAALAARIRTCPPHQAIVLGALARGLSDIVPITTMRNLQKHPGYIARTREYISYRHGEPAWALIDYDTKGMPPGIRDRIDAAGGMWAALLGVAPGLASAARVSRASTSAGLYRVDTQIPIPGSEGMHHYILAADGGDIARFLHDLHDRCWLHSLGWHLIGASGQLLDRSIVDRMVGSGERLCFEGAPLIVSPLAQNAAAREPCAVEGTAIDTCAVVPPLTEYDRQRVHDAKTASKNALGHKAKAICEKHDGVLAEKIATEQSIPLPTARRMVSVRHNGILMPCVGLHFDDGRTDSVADVLADPSGYISETLADPLEGVEYGRCKAMVMRADNGGLLIHSFAHGRAIYHLRHDIRTAKAAIAAAPMDGIVDYAMAVLGTASLEADETEDFARALAAKSGTKISAVKARIKQEQQKRMVRERGASHKQTRDGRLVRRRPDDNEELTPTVEFLDEMLASRDDDDRPMRDVNGDLVAVREREPGGLHLLTDEDADSTAGAAQPMKAPPEPGLMVLKMSAISMLIERYVRWEVQANAGTSFGALPRPFIDALAQYAPSVIPTVRAINTAPIVHPSGRVIAGHGLDCATGLYHRIDPALQDCVPGAAPTQDDVRGALGFLLDEFLVDVMLDRSDKCIAVMLALSLIERPLLPERPAFFVTAPQPSSGKSTLLNLITAAVLGRPTAAAAWSNSPEERRKALFSYLRQNVAMLAWDNIPRGESISCPHIEAALTAAEISDRVLGASMTERTASLTIQAFTGNAITPRGDMASRSLILPLRVDRPDPANRAFTHANAFEWLRTHRPHVMRALYTLLLAGATARPQTAKTRFKTWWNLAGWPVEYAADLIGLHVDCDDIMRISDQADEGAAAVAAALTSLYAIWSGTRFTSRDVHGVLYQPIDAIEPGAAVKSDDDGGAKVIVLRDALRELAGKDRDFDQLTPPKIGKLLRQHLIGRPAWIDGRQRYAILRCRDDHNANQHWIEVIDPATEK